MRIIGKSVIAETAKKKNKENETMLENTGLRPPKKQLRQ